MDGFILLYSVTDRKSYNYVVNMLTNIERMRDKYSSTAVILTANKTDLVRKRQVTDRGIQRLIHFISSIYCTHHVDIGEVSKEGRTIMVSKATKRHCAGTVQPQGGRV